MGTRHYHCVIALGHAADSRLMVVCTTRHRSTSAVWKHKETTSQRQYGGEYGAYGCIEPADQCPRFNAVVPIRPSYREDIPG